ncbi:MAG: MAPEG family protein [Spongiibacteraceae bacterium]|jgi:uncharacterized MAPEG superfamily protein|nr:MAPEG family protein [Spongiibacteraceae bacterium]
MTIALWCLLAAGLLPLAFSAYAKRARGFDNNNPRAWFTTLEGSQARAVAAMENSFEGLPLFVAAVLTAHMLKGPQASADLLALTYVVLRVIYGVLYIAGLGTLRSLTWLAGLACVIGLFIIAA